MNWIKCVSILLCHFSFYSSSFTWAALVSLPTIPLSSPNEHLSSNEFKLNSSHTAEETQDGLSQIFRSSAGDRDQCSDWLRGRSQGESNHWDKSLRPQADSFINWQQKTQNVHKITILIYSFTVMYRKTVKFKFSCKKVNSVIIQLNSVTEKVGIMTY